MRRTPEQQSGPDVTQKLLRHLGAIGCSAAKVMMNNYKIHPSYCRSWPTVSRQWNLVNTGTDGPLTIGPLTIKLTDTRIGLWHVLRSLVPRLTDRAPLAPMTTVKVRQLNTTQPPVSLGSAQHQPNLSSLLGPFYTRDDRPHSIYDGDAVKPPDHRLLIFGSAVVAAELVRAATEIDASRAYRRNPPAIPFAEVVQEVKSLGLDILAAALASCENYGLTIPEGLLPLFPTQAPPAPQPSSSS